MTKYKKFKMIDVLNWQSQKEIDPLKIKELTVESDRKYPFYGQATINNGIISYLSLKESVLNNKEGLPTILIHSNNQNIVYLETPFYLKDGHGATSVLQSPYLNETIALYLITCIKKVITEKFTYNEKATKIALKNTEIELPIKEDENIDYDYMEQYVDEMIKKTKMELNTELSKTKTELLEEEKKALNNYKNGSIIFEKFDFEELFVSENGDTDIQQKDIDNQGEIVISAGEYNNGIVGRSSIRAKILDKNTITIDMFGNVNFRDFNYKMVTHARVFSIRFKDKELTIEEGLFIEAQMKYLKEVFSYNDMASWEKIRKRKIDLPTKGNKIIDFEFMNNYVKAIQKNVIASSNIE